MKENHEKNHDTKKLIKSGLIPIAKYWSIRLAFLDIINNTRLFIPLIENRADMGDDVKAAVRISKEWQTQNDINVGEAGFLYRLLQFASWKYGLNKNFIKERTLKTRNITNNPEIINWPLAKLLELDNETSQWASAAILTGNTEKVENDYFLDLTREALDHYKNARKTNTMCEVRYDHVLQNQALAFIELKETGHTDYQPTQPDEYPFARIFGLVSKDAGEKRWPQLHGHESDRIVETEIQLQNLAQNRPIDSKDHRIVQAIAMLATIQNKKPTFTHPECVSKSWPQFWEFLIWSDKITA